MMRDVGMAAAGDSRRESEAQELAMEEARNTVATKRRALEPVNLRGRMVDPRAVGYEQAQAQIEANGQLSPYESGRLDIERRREDRLSNPQLNPYQEGLLEIGRGKLEGAGNKPELSPAAESNIINRLSNQWNRATGQLTELRRQADLMELGLSEAKKGNTAAGAQAVLVTFQKILDPTSVVRESEYFRSAAGQAALDRIQGAYERLVQGGAGVPIAELEGFANLARQAVQNASSSGSINALRERIGGTADRYGIPRDLVIQDIPGTGAPQAPAQAQGGGGERRTTPDGKTWERTNGGWREVR